VNRFDRFPVPLAESSSEIASCVYLRTRPTSTAGNRSKRFTKRVSRPLPPDHDDDDGALAGTLPIALGLGAVRNHDGLSVWRSSGGLVVSQMLTLYITPV